LSQYHTSEVAASPDSFEVRTPSSSLTSILERPIDRRLCSSTYFLIVYFTFIAKRCHCYRSTRAHIAEYRNTLFASTSSRSKLFVSSRSNYVAISYCSTPCCCQHGEIPGVA
jgi:hypothetical protein